MDPTEREIVSRRVINTPRERVFRAFTERDHLEKWWGPKDFRNTFSEFDPRAGGCWRFVMHAPDGTNYLNESIFLEVVEPERIVLRHLEPVHDFQMTMLFAEQAESTELTWKMLFSSAEHCEEIRPFVIEANEQNFDRLEAELARMA